MLTILFFEYSQNSLSIDRHFSGALIENRIKF